MLLLSRAVGTFLILVGLAFIVLLVLITKPDGIPIRLTVPAFMLGFGILLVWAGSNLWRPPAEGERRHRYSPRLDRLLIKSRSIVELLAAMGCGLVLSHIVATCLGVNWPPATLLWILNVAPVCTGLLTIRILVPGAFQAGLFASEVWNRWSTATHLLVKIVLRVGWVGYIAVFFTLLHLDVKIPARWHVTVQIVSSSLLCFVYASQLVALHFGRTEGAGV